MTTKFLPNKPVIWTISGSDCSGGAGIAADIKTGHVLGCEVCHLTTANTVQNAKQLVAVNPVAVDILQQQASCLLEDKTPQVIKFGLIANREQIHWLIDLLASIKVNIPTLKVIYDPVGQASVGGKFSALNSTDLLPLLPYIDIITPNTLEAKQLASLPLNNDPLTAQTLAENIQQLGVNTVIIKGGHPLTDDPSDPSLANQPAPPCVDYCLHRLTDADSSKMSQDETISYGLNSPRINTDYSHGGGCSFASALAAFSAHGYLVRDAFTLSKAFINQGLTANIGKLEYYGAFEQTSWPTQTQHFPVITSEITDKYQALPAFNSLGLNRKEANTANNKLGLYPVIDSLYWLERLLPLKLNIIQLRVKNKTAQELDVIIKQAVELNKQYPQTRLFINDYWQLAIKHGAYGVHIGQEDLMTADLAQIQQAGLRLGISTHGCYEFLLAQQLQPSYLAIGAIFPTKTKDMTGQIQGIKNLTETLQLATHIPVVAIGGINHQRAVEVLATGVDSIAVVTAITEAENPEDSVALFNQLIAES
ncbi:thiamine phosphate synthase [Thalassotalea agariperforans]